MTRSEEDHSIFNYHLILGCIYLIIYVDDIVLRDNDHYVISQWNNTFVTHFQTKDLEKLIYFLGIEVARSNSGIIISQRNYELDILEETKLMNSKFVNTPTQ